MEDLKNVIAKNIVMLRRRDGMTQIELAQRLNYSDKAVSKWERGESLPDVVVLKAVADTFGVSVDYLLEEEHAEMSAEPVGESAPQSTSARKTRRLHIAVTAMSTVLVWVIATLLFAVFDFTTSHAANCFMVFVYAVDASLTVWLVFNSIWHNRRRNYLIVSALMWAVLASVYLSVLLAGFNVWTVFLLGVPGQIIIVLWSAIGRKK